MAKRVIILDSVGTLYHVVLWADVPVARQPFYAAQGARSQWNGASQAEHDAIASGAVAERVIEFNLFSGEGLAAVRARLQATWQAYQDEIAVHNSWARYGTFWDGTTWTAGGVA